MTGFGIGERAHCMHCSQVPFVYSVITMGPVAVNSDLFPPAVCDTVTHECSLRANTDEKHWVCSCTTISINMYHHYKGCIQMNLTTLGCRRTRRCTFDVHTACYTRGQTHYPAAVGGVGKGKSQVFVLRLSHSLIGSYQQQDPGVFDESRLCGLSCIISCPT